MEAFADILFDLYRMARELPPAAFQDRALALLMPLLKFQSAIWGSGRLTNPGLCVHRIHLHEIDPDGLTAWKQINRMDKVIPIAAANPGRTIQFHAPTLFSARDDAEMRDYAQRYGRQSYLITAFASETPSLMGWMSLYRPDPDDPFTGLERTLCEALMPHFEQALLVNQACNVQKALSEETGTSASLALADARGALYFAQAAFLRLLAEEWPEADDRMLPPPLRDAVIGNSAGGTFLGARIRFESRVAAELILLRARRRRPIDQLSPRRYEVARLFSSGFGYKAIARQLHLSPATVRNHLTAIYQELSIASKAELVAAAGDLKERQPLGGL